MNKPTQNHLIVFSNNLSQKLLHNYVPTESVQILASPQWNIRDERLAEIHLELPDSVLTNAENLIPSFSSLVPGNYAYQFSLKAQLLDGIQTPEYHLSSIGRTEENLDYFFPTSSSGDVIGVEIDFFTIKNQLKSAFLTLKVVTSNMREFINSPYLLSIQESHTGYKSELDVNKLNFKATSIEIPAISQMVQEPTISHRICSPTNIAMILQSFSLDSKLADIVTLAYNLENDMYGVWPANIWAASRWGVLGYVASFSSWKSVALMLERNIPIVASIKYKKGELTNAAVEETSGHLVTICGLQQDKWVLVNDPAAPSNDTVKRKYRLDELTEVWIKRGGIGYILFPSTQIC